MVVLREEAFDPLSCIMDGKLMPSPEGMQEVLWTHGK